ncbi:DUF1588 domain-containing protein [Lentisphaera profundi]|uniref:DUF1588 domain-containing protein n=1 Tax=Lentisphaera profundi TaxID=1658616 RepID=A0ABY7VWL2_9BACT|nr:DUF1588 domain-containing protein [Lentisphaera profundi]WDE97585.1 DUF1588 domain-containing protein [Lentisphaera profundi]
MSEDNSSEATDMVLSMSAEDKEALRVKLAELEILEEKISTGELSEPNASDLMNEVLNELSEIEQRLIKNNAEFQQEASTEELQEIESELSEVAAAVELVPEVEDLEQLKVLKSSQNLKPWEGKSKVIKDEPKITLKDDQSNTDKENQVEPKSKPSLKTKTQAKRQKTNSGSKKPKLKIPTKVPRVQKKKPFPKALVALILIVGSLAYFHRPIIDYVKKQQADIAERNKVEEPKEKEKPKPKPKPKRIVKKEIIVEVEPEEVVEPEPEEVEELFTGELTHYSFNQVLKDNCISCHGEKGKEIEGEFNLVTLMNSKSLNTRAWAKVYRSINKGEMPPEEDAEPLENEEKELLLSSIKLMHENLKETANTRVLTPFEIENTMVDLFDFNTGTYNPFDSLHTAYSEKIFYTHQRQVLSPYYLAQYYHIMYDVLKSFVGLKPQIDKLNLKPSLTRNVHTSVNGKNYLDLRWNWQNRIDLVTYKNLDEKKQTAKQSRKVKADENTAVVSEILKKSLPPGTYTLRFHGEAMNMDLSKITEKKYGEDLVDTFKEWKQRIGEDTYGLPIKFFIAPPGVGDAYATTQYLESVEVSSAGEYAIEFTLKRRAAIGFTLDIDYPNESNLASKLAYFKYGEEADLKAREEMGAKYFRTIKYDFPMLRLKKVRIEGPYNVQIHPLSFDEEQRKKHIGVSQVGDKFKTLHSLLGIKNNIIYQYIFKDFQVDKLEYEDAYRNALMMFFLSPQFLIVDNKPKTTEDFMRFSSYALLKTAPDNEFKKRFMQAKKLRKPELLGEWLVKSPNFRRFISPFTYQWLKLGEIKNNLPDEESFSTYYAKNFEDAFRVEAELFVENLFKNNRPIREIVKADYAMLNPDLVDFYNGVGWAKLRGRDVAPVVSEFDFSQQEMTDENRGGILGMGAFLTSTGNGVDPLPLRRAAWISENILDSPLPSPPNVDVELFVSDQNAKTLRERLAVHAQDPACNSCHKKMDSLAIIMDRFDSIGGDNNHYVKDPVKINNQRINDLVELKDYLVKYEKATARAFSKKLISYMFGREPGVQDESKLDRIITECEKDGYRVADLYTAIIKQYFLN